MCFCPCFRKKKKEKKSKIESKKEIEMSTKTIKLIIIGDEKDEDVDKIKNHIKKLFFNKASPSKNVNTTIYKNSNITLEVTLIPFIQIHYCSQKKYDHVISLCSKKEEHIEIIKTFNKTNYILKNICKGYEILEQCRHIIEENDFYLVKHFRKEINNILDISRSKSPTVVSYTATSDSNADDDNDGEKLEGTNKNPKFPLIDDKEEIMKDSLITSHSKSDKRTNIDEKNK